MKKLSRFTLKLIKEIIPRNSMERGETNRATWLTLQMELFMTKGRRDMKESRKTYLFRSKDRREIDMKVQIISRSIRHWSMISIERRARSRLNSTLVLITTPLSLKHLPEELKLLTL